MVWCKFIFSFVICGLLSVPAFAITVEAASAHEVKRIFVDIDLGSVQHKLGAPQSGLEDSTGNAATTGFAIGYYANETMAIGFGYHDFGSASLFESSNVSIKSSGDVQAFYGLWSTPFRMQGWGYYAQLGLGSLDYDVITKVGSNASVKFASHANVGIIGGLGAVYKYNEWFSLTMNAIWVQGETSTEPEFQVISQKVDMLFSKYSVGLRVFF